MVSRVATTRPRFHQGSVRSVRSLICARVLVGASESCVIQRPRCALSVIVTAARGQAARKRAGGRGAHAMPTNLFLLVSGCRIRVPFQGVSLATLPVSACVRPAFGEQAHTADTERWHAPPPAKRGNS